MGVARRLTGCPCAHPPRGDLGTTTGKGIGDVPTDLSNSTGADLRPSSASLNGTYNTRLLADEAARLVTAHDPADPFYMYLQVQRPPSPPK